MANDDSFKLFRARASIAEAFGWGRGYQFQPMLYRHIIIIIIVIIIIMRHLFKKRAVVHVEGSQFQLLYWVHSHPHVVAWKAVIVL